MVFHGSKWGWRAVATRLLLAPVVAAGVTAPVVAQQPPAGGPKTVGATAPAQPPGGRVVSDPRELLKLGRDALKAGDLDRAQDLARQADAANKSGRWGLFEDTPESLEADVRDARLKRDKVQGEQLTRQAREAFHKAQGMKVPAEKMAALDQAYAMADRAAALQGPADFFDDLFGPERADKVKKEIDAARIQLRKTTPASELAKVPAAPSKGGPVEQAKSTAKPGETPPMTTAGGRTMTGGVPAAPVAGNRTAPSVPAAPVTNTTNVAAAQAKKLLAEGRGYLKQNKLTEAKAKADEARKLNAPLGPGDDTPDALTRDVMADGKAQVDSLLRSADALAAKKEYARAEAALAIARQTSAGLGFQTKPIDEKLASIAAAKGGTVTAAEKPAAPPAAPTVGLAGGPVPPPSIPDVGPKPTSPAAPVAQAPAKGPEMPIIPVLPGASADPVAQGPTTPVVPALPAEPAANPVAKNPAPPAPVVPALPPAVAATGPVGARMLADATKELQKGELESARKMAVQAMNADPALKPDALALLREIDAEKSTRTRRDAVASLQAAREYYQAKQYEQAVGVLRLIDTAALPPGMATEVTSLLNESAGALARAKGGVAVAGGPDAAKAPAAPLPPGVQPPASGLSDQVKALSEVEFQKLRSEGLDVRGRAQQAFNKGETELAIQLLTDYATKVRASSQSAGRQQNLLAAVDRDLDTYRIMKRQMDFLTAEAKGKREARDQLVGKSLAEQQKKEEIAKKVREVHDLIKAHKYREAEALALQTKELDRDDPTLAAVYELARRQRRVDDYQKIKDEKEAGVLELLNEADKLGKVPTGKVPMSVDVEATLRAMRRGDGSDLYIRTRTEKERQIELRLDKPLSVEFKNAPFREVLDTLRKETQLNITVDDASLADEKVSLDSVTVTETLKDLSLRNVLDIVLDKARLKYVIEHDAIRVTTEKMAKGRLYTKVFSVMDLVTPVPDFALAPYMNLTTALDTSPTPAWTPGPNGTSTYNPTGGLQNGQLVSQPNGVPAPAGSGGTGTSAGYGTLDNRASPLASSASLAANPRANASAQLMKLITGMVRPYSWSEMGGPGKLDYYDIGGALVVNQTADVIREVQDLLEALRRLQETSVSVEVRVISLSEAFFERVGVDFSMNIKTKQGGRDGSSFERSLTTGQFRPEPFINDINARGVTVGWNPAVGGFTPDLDVPIRGTSYGLALPPFGGYQTSGLSPTLNGGLSLGLAFLNDIQVFMFLEAAQGDRRVNVMQAPKVTLFNGQTSTVFVSDIAFFTTGLQVINVGGQFVYIPQNRAVPIGTQSPAALGVQSASPGVLMTIQAIVSADRRFVRLNLTPTLTALTSATVPLFPVTAFITPVFEGGSQGVPIPFTQFFQQPTLNVINVSSTVAVPDGGTVVLGGLKALSEGRNEFGPPVISSIPYLNRLFRNQGIGRETHHIMIMVTPRIIINSEEEFNQTGTASGSTPAAVIGAAAGVGP